jgi:hypothetical protein
LGLFILIKPVAVIDRRWYLAVVIPLLLANTLALIENSLKNDLPVVSDWRFWLVIIVDIILLIGSILLFRGYQIFGLDGSELMGYLVEMLEGKHIATHLHKGEKSNYWRTSPNALILTIELQDKKEDLWVTESMGEVLLRSDSNKGLALIREEIPGVKRMKKPYLFKAHAMGILYIVLAVVLAVFGWIFFFEPRLIVVD